MLTLERLIGRLTDEPEVVDTFAAFGLEPKLIEDSTTAQALSIGLEVGLHTPWSVKLPRYASLEKKPKKRPYARAVVFDATVHAEGTMCWVKSGPAKQVPAGRFEGALPRSIQWSDSASSLVERFGPPRFSTADKATGALTWLRWNLPDEELFFMVNASPAGALMDVTLGLLVKK